ncbi:MAG: NAD(P)/FAD-dependent oxidoreductase, partial [Pyrinomonadaceae bacterium]
EKDEFHVGKMGVLYESLLRECLENGVLFSGGTSYVSAEMLKNETIVRLKKSGRNYEVRTKVLIGADGANSRVAEDLKLDENKEWIVGYEEVFHSENKSSQPRLHCFLDARLAPGYLAWIADDTEEIHIGVGGYAADFNPREALKLFKEKTGKLFNLKNAKLIETRGGRIPVGGVLRQIANENGILIGDAAGAVSPLTAGGLDPAMRLSKFAAEIVRERLQADDPKILLQYSGELFRARFISRLWMRRIIKTFTNQNLLELGFTFLRGKLGEKFVRHVFFGRGSFPDVELKRLPVSNYRKSEI